MPPFLKDSLGSIIRALIAGPLAWFVTQGFFSESEAEQYGAAAAAFIIAAGWGIWQKYKSRQKLVTALASTKPTTEEAVMAKVADGRAPSVSTPVTVVPTVTAVEAGD